MYTLVCAIKYKCSKYKKIQKYIIFTLITNYKHHPMVIKNSSR